MAVMAGLAFQSCRQAVSVSEAPKPRTVVTCDPELDDNNSMVRFILHATDFDIEGLVETSSQFHWAGDGKGTLYFHPGREYDHLGLGPLPEYRWEADSVNFINRILDAYEQCYPNLKTHDPDYPTPEYLKSISVVGNIDFEGEMDHDTEGSDLVKERILADKPGTLFLQAWGGTNTIARALKSIEEEYKGTPQWDSIVNVINSRVVLCMSGEQDDTYKDYIHPSWPGIKRQSVGGSGLGLSYNSQSRLRVPADSVYYSAEWMAENVLSRGPLGARVRVWGDGKQIEKGFDPYDYFGIAGKTADELKEMGYQVWTPPRSKGEFLGEGDDGCFLNMIDNGLRAWQDDSWGGWAGRSRKIPKNVDPSDMRAMYRLLYQADTIFPDFVPEAQNAYAARLAWSVTPEYADANHYPVVEGPLAIEAAPGKTVKIKADVSDPDGDGLSMKWKYFKVGTYEGEVSIATDGDVCKVNVPADAKPGQTIHILLHVSDNGTPQLSRYLRTVITVK